jgi:hypothetical protein
MADTTGMADLRAEHVEKIVKGFALQEYRMKELVMIMNSNAWQESFYQETATELTGSGTRTVKGIPRLAQFPYGEVSWTKKASYQLKHGMEGVISWEDAMTNNIDVIARTLLRIARAVAKSVDAEIYSALTENDTPATINTVAITAGNEWDSATVANRDPVQDILNAKKELYTDNFNPDNGNGYIIFSPKDYANCLANAKFAHFFQEEIGKNGKVGRILGLNVIVSNSVTADKCLVCIAKECATWRSAQPLTVATIQDPGVKWTIRAYEVGTTQLTSPTAVCLITNTQA